MQLIRTLADDSQNCYGGNCPAVIETSQPGLWLVRGNKPDAAMLAELGLPDHESATLVTADMLARALRQSQEQAGS